MVSAVELMFSVAVVGIPVTDWFLVIEDVFISVALSLPTIVNSKILSQLTDIVYKTRKNINE